MKKVYVAMDTMADTAFDADPHVLGVFATKKEAEKRIKEYLEEHAGEPAYENAADYTLVFETEYFLGV